jgi:hypothetical protein
MVVDSHEKWQEASRGAQSFESTVSLAFFLMPMTPNFDALMAK